MCSDAVWIECVSLFEGVICSNAVWIECVTLFKGVICSDIVWIEFVTLFEGVISSDTVWIKCVTLFEGAICSDSLNWVCYIVWRRPLELDLHKDAHIILTEVEEGEEKAEIWVALDSRDRSLYHSLLKGITSFACMRKRKVYVCLHSHFLIVLICFWTLVLFWICCQMWVFDSFDVVLQTHYAMTAHLACSTWPACPWCLRWWSRWTLHGCLVSLHPSPSSRLICTRPHSLVSALSSSPQLGIRGWPPRP